MNPTIWTAIKPIASQAARDLLRTVGMYLAAKGFIQGDAAVTTFIGAGMTLAGLFWGWFTTVGYFKVMGLLKKLTAQHTSGDAVKAATILPPAAAVDTASKSISVQSVVNIMLVAFLLSALFVPAAMAQTTVKKLQITGDFNADAKANLAKAGITVPTVVAGAACDFNVFAALSPKNVVTTIQNCVSQGSSQFLPDVQAALDSATAYKDQPGIDCLTPSLAIVKAAAGTPAVVAADGTVTTPAVLPGVILIFQKFREFTLANGTAACKNWVQSTVNNVASGAL